MAHVEKAYDLQIDELERKMPSLVLVICSFVAIRQPIREYKTDTQ